MSDLLFLTENYSIDNAELSEFPNKLITLLYLLQLFFILAKCINGL